MRPSELSEAASVLSEILWYLSATVPSSSQIGINGAKFKGDIGALQASSAEQISAGAVGAPLAQCFSDATAAGATFVLMDGARQNIMAIVTISPTATLLKYIALIYSLAQMIAIIGATTYTARDTVEQLIAYINNAFDTIEEATADAGDSNVYNAVVSMHASTTQYLLKVAQPLPRIINYQTGKPLPALVLAQMLYADPTRADELVAENHVIAPLFMPTIGVCLSD